MELYVLVSKDEVMGSAACTSLQRPADKKPADKKADRQKGKPTKGQLATPAYRRIAVHSVARINVELVVRDIHRYL